MRISDWSSDVCSSDLLFDRRVEPGAPFLDMTIEVRFDGERQRPLLAKRVEGGRREEVAIEIAELAASRDPYVPRAQPLPYLGQGALFIGSAHADYGPPADSPPGGGDTEQRQDT